MKLNRDKAGSGPAPLAGLGRQGALNGSRMTHDARPDTEPQAPNSAAPMSPVLPFLKQRIVLKIPSDISILDRVLEYINEHLLELGIAGPDDTEILVALDEAIVNAIKHGNKNDPKKKVKIVAEMNARGARFTIRDEGPGFSREGVADPTDPVRLLMPCGRGLLLINHIMDHVTHNDTGNEIRMVLRSRCCKPPRRSRSNGNSHQA